MVVAISLFMPTIGTAGQYFALSIDHLISDSMVDAMIFSEIVIVEL
jgi:hypothetical protein